MLLSKATYKWNMVKVYCWMLIRHTNTYFQLKHDKKTIIKAYWLYFKKLFDIITMWTLYKKVYLGVKKVYLSALTWNQVMWVCNDMSIIKWLCISGWTVSWSFSVLPKTHKHRSEQSCVSMNGSYTRSNNNQSDDWHFSSHSVEMCFGCCVALHFRSALDQKVSIHFVFPFQRDKHFSKLTEECKVSGLCILYRCQKYDKYAYLQSLFVRALLS